MKHLGYLKILNFIYAGFFAGTAVLVVIVVQLMWALQYVIEGIRVPSPGEMVLASLVSVVLLVIAWLYYKAGTIVAEARGRKLQTGLIALSIGNCPGILYAGYALWVCWVHAETVAAFEGKGAE